MYFVSFGVSMSKLMVFCSYSNSLNPFDTAWVTCRAVGGEPSMEGCVLAANLDSTARAFLQRKETKLFQLHRSPTSGFVFAELVLMHSKILN